METFFMSLRLFSATSAYFCDLKSEWPQIFKKWCSSTDSKMVRNRWLANSNAFYVKQLWRISEIALASPKPNMSYFIRGIAKVKIQIKQEKGRNSQVQCKCNVYGQKIWKMAYVLFHYRRKIWKSRGTTRNASFLKGKVPVLFQTK